MSTTSLVVVSGSAHPGARVDDRVTTYYGGGDSVLSLAVSEYFNAPSDISKIPGNTITPLTTSHISIPRSYFGMNTGAGASNLPMQESPMNDYSFGLVRSHDNKRVTWNSIEHKVFVLTRSGNVVSGQTNGVYGNGYVVGDTITISNVNEPGFSGDRVITSSDGKYFTYNSEISGTATATSPTFIMSRYWGHLDAWVAVNAAAGRKLMYTLYGTPYWATSKPTSVGPYSGGGANAAPTNPADLGNFAGLVAQRYKDKGTPIDFWELSNECNFIGSGGRFFDGTAAELAPMMRAMSLAVKAITPNAKMISPSMTDLEMNATTGSDLVTTFFPAMMAASDGVGGTMAQYVDYVGVHLYGYSEKALVYINLIKSLRDAAGLSSKPIIDSENGSGSNASDWEFYASMVRKALIPALSGIYSHSFYALGSCIVKPAATKAVSDLFEKVITYGIDSSSFLADGRLAFVVNGKKYIV